MENYKWSSLFQQLPSYVGKKIMNSLADDGLFHFSMRARGVLVLSCVLLVPVMLSPISFSDVGLGFRKYDEIEIEYQLTRKKGISLTPENILSNIY